jgi:hypothetical protein
MLKQALFKVWLVCVLTIFTSVAAFPQSKTITIIAVNTPNMHWESSGLLNEGGILKVPVDPGDILHFVFSDEIGQPPIPHGITTRKPADLPKVQRRGETPNSASLHEVGEGQTRFGPQAKFTPTKPNEDITQVEVLPNFHGSLELMCSVHLNLMRVTLTRK